MHLRRRHSYAVCPEWPLTCCRPPPFCCVLLGSRFTLPTDAEAAFKKLTAAFETLHDPARQALSRAEAQHRSRGARHTDNRGGTSSSSRGSSGGGNHEHGAGERSGGSGPSAEAPRWCREGEYVPEAKPDTGRREVRQLAKSG